MKKLTTMLATAALAMTFSAACYAQQDQTQPKAPQSPADRPSAQEPAAAAPDQSATPAAQSASFTGSVVKAGDQYVLKTADINYQLDDQEKAKQFVGQQVTVVGTLDPNTSMIHISDITPAS